MRILVNHWRMDSSLNALIHCSTGEVRRLGEYHFILLETLVGNADTVLSRSFLMSEVWKNRVVGGNSLPTAIHALRTAIDDNGKQQEIIKTIPKKGYLFNKDYISVINDDEKKDEETQPGNNTNAVDEDQLMNGNVISESNDNNANICIADTDSAAIESTNSAVRKKNAHKMLLCTSIFMVLVLSVLALFYFLMPQEHVENAPRMTKEAIANVDRITVYHIYNEGVEKKTNSPFALHLHDGINQTNQLLTQRNASIALYYKVSFSELAMNIILKNRCDHHWQLALRFNNWQNKDAEIDTIMFQEVENMLNEMPTCQ